MCSCVPDSAHDEHLDCGIGPAHRHPTLYQGITFQDVMRSREAGMFSDAILCFTPAGRLHGAGRGPVGQRQDPAAAHRGRQQAPVPRAPRRPLRHARPLCRLLRDHRARGAPWSQNRHHRLSMLLPEVSLLCADSVMCFLSMSVLSPQQCLNFRVLSSMFRCLMWDNSGFSKCVAVAARRCAWGASCRRTTARPARTAAGAPRAPTARSSAPARTPSAATSASALQALPPIPYACKQPNRAQQFLSISPWMTTSHH